MDKNQTNTEKSEMDFKARYQGIKAEFRNKICELLGITEEAFYAKVRRNSWRKAEKTVIADFLKADVEELFPKESKSNK